MTSVPSRLADNWSNTLQNNFSSISDRVRTISRNTILPSLLYQLSSHKHFESFYWIQGEKYPKICGFETTQRHRFISFTCPIYPLSVLLFSLSRQDTSLSSSCCKRIDNIVLCKNKYISICLSIFKEAYFFSPINSFECDEVM